MLIGTYDAQALAVVLEGLKPTSPLPLDLLEDAIKKFEYQVQEVIIDSLKNNYYTAKIICNRGMAYHIKKGSCPKIGKRCILGGISPPETS